ncbi:MAG TPA: DDE-type integrase/transposase/recombinase [Waterburya sp.]|jgi:putative transposase
MESAEISPTQDTEAAQTDQEQPPTQEYTILIELIEDLDQKKEVMRKVEAIEEILQADEELKPEKIQQWADRLEKHPRTIRRWLEKVEKEGLAAIARTTRSDAGQLKGCKRWKHGVKYWVEFIINTYQKAKKAGLGMTPNLVYNQVKGHAELELGLKEGEYPSHMFVYKVLNPIIERKNRKVRNPGQGPGIIVKTTDGDIVVTRSNQVWQIDHTLLNNLLVDANGELVNCAWITSVIDTYSGCVMGYHIGFESPGSHEVALALRHAILQKHYGEEYQLQHEWEVCGLPEYIVTDRAKEFKSAHLRHIAADLGFKMRLRLYTEQGGVVENSFLGLKTEFAALVPGFKGGSLEERPKNPEKKACVVYEEYDRKLVRHFVDHRNRHIYPRVKNQTRLQRWWIGLIGGTPRMPNNERELDICLMKEAKRKVQERGSIDFVGLVYTASLSRDDEGYWRYDKAANFLKDYEGYQVTLRYNPSNIVYILVYTREKNGQPSKYLGTIRARDLEEERLSLKEWEDRKKKIRDEGKAIDQSSILAEQRDLYTSSIKQVKTLKGRRKTEQRRITHNSGHSKVVKLHPEDASTGKKKGKTVTSAIASEPAEGVESEYEQTEMPVKPALFVVPDWDEFMEDNW